MNATGGRAPRWLLAVGITGTVFIAALAFWLSFTALTHLAERAGVAVRQAWAWPLTVDGVIVVATIAAVALRDRKGAGYAWLLLTCGAAVSVTANAVQAAMPAGRPLAPALAAAVCSVPPAVLLAVTHLTVVLARHDPRPQRADSQAPALEPAPGDVFHAGPGANSADGVGGPGGARAAAPAAGPVWGVGAGGPTPSSGRTARGPGRVPRFTAPVAAASECTSTSESGPQGPRAEDGRAAAGPADRTGAGGPPGVVAGGDGAGPRTASSAPDTASESPGFGPDSDPADGRPVGGSGSEPVLGAAEVRALMWGADAPGGGAVGEGSRTSRAEEAARLRTAGLSNKEIAGRMGVNASTVGRWLRQAGEHRAGQQ